MFRHRFLFGSPTFLLFGFLSSRIVEIADRWGIKSGVVEGGMVVGVGAVEGLVEGVVGWSMGGRGRSTLGQGGSRRDALIPTPESILAFPKYSILKLGIYNYTYTSLALLLPHLSSPFHVPRPQTQKCSYKCTSPTNLGGICPSNFNK